MKHSGKSLIASAFAALIFGNSAAFAGGSSTVGPGGPRFQYRCADAQQNIFVDIVSFPSDYSRLTISVQTMIPMTVHEDRKVNVVANLSAGSPKVFRGERFEVSILTTAPKFDGGKVLLNASLKDSTSWESTRALQLECEPVSQ